MPVAEIDIDAALVRALLHEQHDDLADLPLRLVANGWDNAIFRLGPDLCVRLPRRQLAAQLVRHEQRWLPRLARHLPLPVPAPVRLGRPGHGYPWCWSVCGWFDGEVAADADVAVPRREAERLGGFVAALHRLAPADAPANPFRGGPTDQLTERLEGNLEALARPRAGDVRERWAHLVTADPWEGPPLWVHGDLHTANVIVADGRIEAVVDFGDMTGADPAVDLAIAWMLFEAAEREVFRSAAGTDAFPVDDATWQRAESWALHFAVLYLANSADNPRFARMGAGLLANVLDS